MSLLLSPGAIAPRRAAIDASPDLRALRVGLARDLDPFLERPLYIPAEKALLSRWGSLCRDDGAELAFDPFSPEAQRCGRCGRAWSTEPSRRWWVYWYQLWLAERTLVAAHLAAFTGEPGFAIRARAALEGLADAYPGYPVRDNVLGPSRPFFSTYLESVWVLQLAASAALLRDLGELPEALDRRLAGELFRPSIALIEDFPESANRQVWHAAARYAVGRLLGDAALCEDAAHGPRGILATLDAGLGADGLWFEGENYHWFALRGLVWGAEMLRSAEVVDLWGDPGDHGAKFRAAFRAPVLTALPDFTFPARRDAKFGVSLRQRRMAELWELAWARLAEPHTASLLRHVYDPAVPLAGDGVRTITDVERNEPPAGVRRAALGWKALAWMAPELPDADPDAWRPGSAHLESSGLAILRRDAGRTYVSLDYGESGGAHGHPDRLNVTVHAGGIPWLLDFGTGSYVSESLAWYRSTFAHNAPAVDGASQLPADGVCIGFDDGAEFGWVCAQLPDGSAFHGAALQRTLVVAPGYVLDVLQMMSSTAERTLMLPWHGLGLPAADELGVTFTRPDAALRIVLSARQPFRIEMHRAPGPPDRVEEMEFPLAVSPGEEVTLAACLDLGAGVEDLECVEGTFLVRLADGTVHTHQASDEGWSVDLGHGDPVMLGGLRAIPEERPPMPEPAPAPVLTVPRIVAPPALDGTLSGFAGGAPIVLDRADQFRRAEEVWPGPEGFSARAALSCLGTTLYVGVEVVVPEPFFRSGDAADPELENENPDIHCDGLQVYLDAAGFFGWLIVPDVEKPGRLRVAPARGTDAEASMVTDGAWTRTARGYGVTFAIELPVEVRSFGFDLYVNRGREGHERRVGQLVWSGAQGTRLYLAGDRALPGALPVVEVQA